MESKAYYVMQRTSAYVPVEGQTAIEAPVAVKQLLT